MVFIVLSVDNYIADLHASMHACMDKASYTHSMKMQIQYITIREKKPFYI
jgi:hypothetical protein